MAAVPEALGHQLRGVPPGAAGRRSAAARRPAAERSVRPAPPGGRGSHLRLLDGGAEGGAGAAPARRGIAGSSRPCARTSAAALPSAAAEPAAVRRRAPSPVARFTAGALTVGGIAALWLGASALRASGATHPVRLPGTVATARGYRYVVRPGDTLWGIAVRVEPGADPRSLVDSLGRQLDGAALQPGDVLVVP